MAMSSFEKSLGKVIKEYKDSFADIDSSGSINYLKLRSPALNYAFGGKGLALGRITELSAQESHGKTTLATLLAVEIQNRPKKNVVLYVDFEYSLDLDHARSLGLDTSDATKDPNNGKFIFLRPTVAEHTFEIIKELVSSGEIGLIIWDSVVTSPTHSMVENDVGKSTFGGIARLFSEGLRIINPWLVRTETPLILINQLRANMKMANMFSDPYATSGGMAIKFYCSTRFRLSRVEDILENGDMVGIKIKIKNQKNKTGIPKRESVFNVLFKGGLQVDPEYVDLATELKIIKKSGSWYKHEETAMAVQGADGVLAFFKDKPEAWQQIKNTVDALIAQKNDLDVEREASEGSGFDLAEED